MRKTNKPTAPTPRLRTLVKAKVYDDGFYVPVSFVTKLTKWDYRMMEYLRDNELITFENRDGALWYQLESVHRVWNEMQKFQQAR
jgi:hypothetical protein